VRCIFRVVVALGVRGDVEEYEQEIFVLEEF
jgi:hypothetical protein